MKAISVKTIKQLFAVSGNLCAFTHCKSSLIDCQTGTVIGEMCHIKGENRNAARYDSAQSAEEKSSFDNLILMCPVHHKIIDANEKTYTVGELQRMKTRHEKNYFNHQLSLNYDAAREFLVKIESNDLNNGSIIVINAPQNGQVAHSIINNDPQKHIIYQRTAQQKVRVGSLQITTQLMSKLGFTLLLIAVPAIILGTFLINVLILKMLPVMAMLIGFSFIFIARPLRSQGYERIGSINLERGKLDDIYITRIQGICPFCGSTVNLRNMPKGSSLKIMGFCERNAEMHTFSFDHTTLTGVYYPIRWEKTNK